MDSEGIPDVGNVSNITETKTHKQRKKKLKQIKIARKRLKLFKKPEMYIVFDIRKEIVSMKQNVV